MTDACGGGVVKPHTVCVLSVSSTLLLIIFDWFLFPCYGSVQFVMGSVYALAQPAALIRPDTFSVPAVHGVWEEWSPWSLCSFTCGRGHRTRTRMCAPPQHGGRACDGPETQTKLCNIALCPGIICLLSEEIQNNNKIGIKIKPQKRYFTYFKRTLYTTTVYN